MTNTFKKLLIFASLIFINGCDITGLIVRNGEKITYSFTWLNILILFIIIAVILWIIGHFTKK